MATTSQKKRKMASGYTPDEDRLKAIVAKNKKVFDQIERDEMP